MCYYEVFTLDLKRNWVKLGVVEALSREDALHYASIKFDMPQSELIVQMLRQVGCCE